MQGHETIVVQDYDPNWPKYFDEIRKTLSDSFPNKELVIEHVGSTAVPGLAAKPIIDVDIIVNSESEVLTTISKLAELGYQHRGDLGVFGREAFHCPAKPYRHNLYVCLAGCISLRNHLTLRDHLRKTPLDRDRYGLLKKALAKNFWDSIDDYVDGKTEFILEILAKYEISADELDSIRNVNIKKN